MPAMTAELGLEQAWDGTASLRLDANYALFSVPLAGTVQNFEMGLKLPTTLADSYLVTKANFAGGNKWEFNEFKAGVGYPLRLDNWVIRGEFVAISPQWSNVAEWKFEPNLIFGFNFNLFDGEMD
jgi:hypothetical protein